MNDRQASPAAAPQPPADDAPSELLGELDDLLIGDLARFRHVLVATQTPGAVISGQAFIQGQTLSTLMARFRPQFASADQRGLASIWFNQYLARLLPPVISAALLLDLRLPLHIEQLAISVDAQGLPVTFKLPGGGQPMGVPGNPFERFAHLLDDNLRPLIEALCALTGGSPRVFWGNAGNYFEAWLGQLSKRITQPERLIEGQRLLSAERRPDGSRNPLYAPIRYRSIEQADGQLHRWRQRRLCCIRDVLPGLGLCPNCPRLKHPNAPA